MNLNLKVNNLYISISLYWSNCCKFYNNNLGGSVLSTCECCMILDSVADWIVS